MFYGDKLLILKGLAGISDGDISQDTELGVYLTVAADTIRRTEYPLGVPDGVIGVKPQYSVLQVRIAHALWQKRGMDFQTGHGENGVNRSYGSEDVPQSLLAQITPVIGVYRQ
ncbi:MAG: hypothetical protein LBT32_01380 [Peptococcaceae bacterium]|jgi:hypothetical protein|nr:hypothetical protein [Peptococcaceae bacterium]